MTFEITQALELHQSFASRQLQHSHDGEKQNAVLFRTTTLPNPSTVTCEHVPELPLNHSDMSPCVEILLS